MQSHDAINMRWSWWIFLHFLNKHLLMMNLMFCKFLLTIFGIGMVDRLKMHHKLVFWWLIWWACIVTCLIDSVKVSFLWRSGVLVRWWSWCWHELYLELFADLVHRYLFTLFVDVYSYLQILLLIFIFIMFHYLMDLIDAGVSILQRISIKLVSINNITYI